MANTNAGFELVKEQILTVLKERYFGMIPPRSTEKAPDEKTADEQIKDRFSRALAAFAIQKLSDCNAVDAVAAIVDCGDDNGIDAIFYDRRQHILWLVQSKFGDAPKHQPNLAFCKGIRDILHEDLNEFYLSGKNKEFDRVRTDVEEALRDTRTIVAACVIYLGNPLERHAINDLEQIGGEFNGLKKVFEWQNIGPMECQAWLAKEQAGNAIEVNLIIEKWNYFTSPHRSVYGLVSADQLHVLYQVHGNAMFQKNIRHFLGNGTVNDKIAQTVTDKPEDLFFFNNGITIICSNFDFAPNHNNRATFTFKNFSIVNGAQTVGAIGTAVQEGNLSPEAKLLVTVLEIGDTPEAVEFGKAITRARNTQNAVNLRDFISLDPNQERLRQELAISEVVYYYRPTTLLSDEQEDYFTLEEATLALACFLGNIAMIVAAKKEISQVYDRDGAHYPKLFTDKLSGLYLYRQVQVFRFIQSILEERENSELGIRKAFFKHGRFFILYVWSKLHRKVLEKSELILSEDDKLEISAQIDTTAERIYDVAEEHFKADHKGYLTIFRNTTDVEQLFRKVMQALTQPVEDVEEAQ